LLLRTGQLMCSIRPLGRYRLRSPTMCDITRNAIAGAAFRLCLRRPLLLSAGAMPLPGHCMNAVSVNSLLDAAADPFGVSPLQSSDCLCTALVRVLLLVMAVQLAAASYRARAKQSASHRAERCRPLRRVVSTIISLNSSSLATPVTSTPLALHQNSVALSAPAQTVVLTAHRCFALHRRHCRCGQVMSAPPLRRMQWAAMRLQLL
jgi:hypothetical protein